jgi:3-hydroxyisobutyrate dehydrogenase-like beta-hydroxyacid dehydrogenase
MTDSPTPVTVIGLGPMGQAMVNVLLGHGHPVTVWNRTASRAADLVARGAKPAATPADAVAASELVLLSLTDYQAMYEILDGVGAAALDGRVLVNLSSDTPERTRQAAAWAAERGASFVAGGIMVPAPLVGQDGAYVFYSGSRPACAAHQSTLRLIGQPAFVGDDPGLAQLFYQAQLDIFLTALSSFLHAAALVASAGVSAKEFLPWAVSNFDSLSSYLPEAAQAIDDGEHPGALATATMMGATADHIVAASQAAGIDLELPRAVQSHYQRAIAAGHGRDGWTSLYEVITKPAA